MKKKEKLHITFHNPNTRFDSESLAREFISHAASGVLTKMILDIDKKPIKNNGSESENDLD